LGGVLVAGLTLTPTAAPASQHPLCPQPRPDDTYYHVCRAGLRPAVSKFLHDLSVDHLYLPPATFSRQIGTVLQTLGMDAFIEADAAELQPRLDTHGNIEFTRLDESTGEFLNKGSGPETLAVERTYLGRKYQITLTLPETLQGLYWRSPIQLELMFYKGHGLRLHLVPSGGEPFEQDIVCVSVTPERARVVTADPNHRHLIAVYEDCP
jgi:hypothetical protein